MIDKRVLLALPALGLLVACGEDASEGDLAATGEVLEGTISDAMLPVDRVRSGPPLEDPEAFAEVQTEAAEAAAETAAPDVADEGSQEASPEPASEDAADGEATTTEPEE